MAAFLHRALFFEGYRWHMAKRSTAIGRLVRFAAEAGDELTRPYPGDYPVVAAWAAGSLLDPATDAVDWPVAVLSIDIPLIELPWMTSPPFKGYLDLVHRFDKGGMRAVYRPAGWPAWNAEFRRVVRFWSKDGGLDEKVIEDLRARRFVEVVEPGVAEFEAQMRDELGVSRGYLDHVLGSFYEREWRQDHKGSGIYPGDHLWWAAAGYRGVEKALRETG